MLCRGLGAKIRSALTSRESSLGAAQSLARPERAPRSCLTAQLCLARPTTDESRDPARRRYRPSRGTVLRSMPSAPQRAPQPAYRVLPPPCAVRCRAFRLNNHLARVPVRFRLSSARRHIAVLWESLFPPTIAAMFPVASDGVRQSLPRVRLSF